MTTPRRYTVQEALDLGLDEVLDLNRKYVNETLVDVISSYGLPRKFVAAEGIRLWDDHGREYLDFLCSYGALGLGHNNPDVLLQKKLRSRSPGAMAAGLDARAPVSAPGAMTKKFGGRRKAYGTKKRATLHSSTFGGNTLACAAAIAAINLVVDQGLATRAAESGRYFRHRLQSVADRFAMLKEIRGRGLMLGLDFTQTNNPLTRAVRNQTAAMVAVQMLHRNNIISLHTFANPNVVRLAPPLDVSHTDLDTYVDALEDVLGRNRTYARLALSTGVLIRRNRP